MTTCSRTAPDSTAGASGATGRCRRSTAGPEAAMTFKASASLTDSQEAFARALVEQGRFPSLGAVLQHGAGMAAVRGGVRGGGGRSWRRCAPCWRPGAAALSRPLPKAGSARGGPSCFPRLRSPLPPAPPEPRRTCKGTVSLPAPGPAAKGWSALWDSFWRPARRGGGWAARREKERGGRRRGTPPSPAEIRAGDKISQNSLAKRRARRYTEPSCRQQRPIRGFIHWVRSVRFLRPESRSVNGS